MARIRDNMPTRTRELIDDDSKVIYSQAAEALLPVPPDAPPAKGMLWHAFPFGYWKPAEPMEQPAHANDH